MVLDPSPPPLATVSVGYAITGDGGGSEGGATERRRKLGGTTYTYSCTCICPLNPGNCVIGISTAGGSEGGARERRKKLRGTLSLKRGRGKVERVRGEETGVGSEQVGGEGVVEARIGVEGEGGEGEGGDIKEKEKDVMDEEEVLVKQKDPRTWPERQQEMAGVLLCVAACCSVLRHVAVCERSAHMIRCADKEMACLVLCVAVCCSVLQRIATCSSVKDKVSLV